MVRQTSGEGEKQGEDVFGHGIGRERYREERNVPAGDFLNVDTVQTHPCADDQSKIG